MPLKRSISVTFITASLIVSIPLISHSPAQTQVDRQTKVNQLLSGKPEQSQTKQAKVVLNPSWKPGTVDVYIIGSGAGGHSLPVRCVAFNPDGQFFASGSADKTIKIWNLRAQTLQRTISQNSDQVISLYFSNSHYENNFHRAAWFYS